MDDSPTTPTNPLIGVLNAIAKGKVDLINAQELLVYRSTIESVTDRTKTERLRTSRTSRLKNIYIDRQQSTRTV